MNTICVARDCQKCLPVGELDSHIQTCPHWAHQQLETVAKYTEIAHKHRPNQCGPVYVNNSVVVTHEKKPYSKADIITIALHVLKHKEHWQSIRAAGDLSIELKKLAASGEHLSCF
jgi:hypothetical protein